VTVSIRSLLVVSLFWLGLLSGLRPAAAAPPKAAANKVVAQPPGALNPGGPALVAGPALKLDGRSEYAVWEDGVRGALSDLVNEATAKCASDALWCAKFGPTGTEFDIASVLQSRALRLALYLSAARSELVDETTKLSDAVRTKLKGQEQTPRFKALEAVNGGHANSTDSAAALTPGSLPSFDLNALAQKLFEGLALALEERAKQEAAEFTLKEVSETLCGDASVKAIWLRDTCAVAASGGMSGSSAESGLSSLVLLRVALERDMRRLPGRLAKQSLKGQAKLEAAVPHLIDALVDGTHPARALDAMARELAPQSGDTVEVKILACAASFPASLQRAQPLLRSAELGLSPSLDPGTRGFVLSYLALESSSCAQALELLLGTGVTLSSRLSQLSADLTKVGGDVDGIASALVDLQQRFDELRKAKTTADLAKRAAALLDEAAGLALDAGRLAHDALSAVAKAAPTQAAAAATAAVSSFDATWATVQPRMVEIQEFARAVSGGDYAGAMTAAFTVAPDLNLEIPEPIKKFAPLIVAIVEAKTPEDVSKALLAAAAPADSWRAKFDSKATPVVTFGGVLGVGATSSAARGTKKWEPRVVAPFGVDAVLTTCTFNLGVFVQLVDVGAYLRSDNSEKAIRPPRVLEAVSPGVALRLGLFKTPLTLAAGGAYDFDAGTDCDTSAGACPSNGPRPGGLRFMTWLGMDVPFFVLHRDH